MRRRCDVDDVRPGGLKHVAEVVEHLRPTEPGGCLVRQVAVAATACDDLSASDFPNLLQVGVRNLPAADQCHSPARCSHGNQTPSLPGDPSPTSYASSWR